MLERYSHISNTAKRQAIEAFGKKTAKKTTKQQAKNE
jgi:hypothetical protein